MDKREVWEMAISEVIEILLSERRENCGEEEKKLYQDGLKLSRQYQKVLEKLSLENRNVIEEYVVKTELIAHHECKHLYIQGARDCVEVFKNLGVL